MRTTFALLVSLFGIPCLAQADVTPPTPGPSMTSRPAAFRYSVDLAKPGALERLEAANPEHYAKVLAVRRAASRPSCVEDLKVLRVELKLDDTTPCARTEDPARRIDRPRAR